MSGIATYIRVNINGKWTNLGIIAEDESELQEHFWFVQDLLEQKHRAGELESRIKLMRDNYLLMLKDAREILKNAPEDKVLKFQIRNYEDVVKTLNKILEKDGEMV